MTEVPVHELKILPEYFDAVRCGDKRFEIRKNDRNYHRGDILRLKEWDGEKYTGEEIDVLVRYILYEWSGGLQEGYCIMSIDTMMHYSPRKAELIKNVEKVMELEQGHERLMMEINKDITRRLIGS